MNVLAKAFVNAVKEGKITIKITDDCNYPEEKCLWFEYAPEGAKIKGTLMEHCRRRMPEVWQAIEFPGEDSVFLHRNNGLVTQFLSVNPNRVSGGYGAGTHQTTLGEISTDGAWSSRAGVLNTLTGQAPIEVIISGFSSHLNFDVACEIEQHLGLELRLSNYSDDEETCYAFFNK